MRKSKAKNAEIATANTPQIHLFLISLLNFWITILLLFSCCYSSSLP